MFTFCCRRSWPMLSRRDPGTPAHPALPIEPALALKQNQAPHLQRMLGELVIGGLAAARAAANPSSALWPPVIR